MAVTAKSSTAQKAASGATTADGDLFFLSATEMADMIRKKDISSVEITRLTLARIDTLDTELGSYAFVSSELALRQAEAADRDLAAGRVRSPLHGVPVAVKDLFDTAGIPTAAGFSFLADRRPAQDSTVVRKLAESGTVLLGKLRLTEGAYAVYNDGKKPPINPWNADYWPGHSSSGSAIATAAGLAFATVGTDTGGSIRYPCSANGVVGLKTTWGRVSRAGLFPCAPSMDHVGPITRSTRDAAAMLNLFAGQDEADPTTSSRPVPMVRPGQTFAFTIGVDHAAIDGTDPAVAEALRETVASLEKNGARIVDVRFPTSAAVISAWNTVFTSEASIAQADQRKRFGASYSAPLSDALNRGDRVTAADLAAATLTRQWLRNAIDESLLGLDAILLPVQRWAPISLADMKRRRGEPDFVPGLLQFTAPTDLSGHPALVLPAPIASGMPIGFQLVGPHFSEVSLLSIGMAIETSTQGRPDWRRHRPPLAP